MITAPSTTLGTVGEATERGSEGAGLLMQFGVYMLALVLSIYLSIY
jgi:hypothetical protein